MTTRRDLLRGGALIAGASALLAPAAGAQHAASNNAPRRQPRMEAPGETPPSARTELPLAPPAGARYTPVVTPNGGTLRWRMVEGVKEFHLVAEPVKREFAPGMVVNCWGYNGRTPGPTIEAVEGERVRILVTNKLPEWTTVHWHGMRVPNGMDGVGGLTQPQIPPGRTMAYEFDLTDAGTYMYHPHADEMLQIAMGMMGFFVVHSKDPAEHAVDRDFVIMLHAWDIDPGAATPKWTTMTDFDMWTMNSRVFPGTDALPVRLGDRVRIRIGNLSMMSHPMHLHGYHFKQTATDGGWIPNSAQWPMTTMNVPVGTTAVMEFVADAPGDWAFHCHRSHHTMNAMSHTLPNLVGVDQRGLDQRINKLLPEYMAMGSGGMADMSQMQMPLPPNTLPMQTGTGPFGPIEMGGMFTVLKVREGVAAGDFRDPGWYRHPPGTLPRLI